MRPGDVLCLAETGGAPEASGPSVRLVGRSAHLAALDKPAGLHTEALAGKTGDSLQVRLDELLPRGKERPRLLNRLDFPTSGLVAAALDEEGAERWRRAQEGGLMEKRYLALLEGELTEERLMRQRLVLKGRERVLVELADHADFRRHTLLRPLAALDARELADILEAAEGRVWRGAGPAPQRATLAACRIVKGARHQIRAHAAAAGFPLWGDRRYGAAWLCGLERENGGERAAPYAGERVLLPAPRLPEPAGMDGPERAPLAGPFGWGCAGGGVGLVGGEGPGPGEIGKSVMPGPGPS